MSSQPRKSKKRRDPKKEVSKEMPPQVVTKTLADNTYSGIIREGALGTQYLECTDAKYDWKSGIHYEGPFVASRIDGKGKLLWPDNSSYEGELNNGKRHGFGVYLGADGQTKYEGQWHTGKRSGKGKLTYNPNGSSYYDGEWLAGKKHGFGKQVWQSGNIYEGEWGEGQMCGQGTMTWRINGVSEQYRGSWAENQPHGQGTHTWHPVDILDPNFADSAPRPAPLNQQQQLNNRYDGQWEYGKRHGKGTFYYANGAYYRGEWRDHMKHGQGRHTFEDGNVYDGPFEEDRMVDYREPDKAEGADLIFRCTDLSDLDAVAISSDHKGFVATYGAGYTDHNKIFREIYNMCLRYLGELREVYAKYRASIPRPGADPFTLQSYQFWLFVRDAGLLTPSCPLARFSRRVFAGPRHHAEISPEDSAQVRPLTPRPGSPPPPMTHTMSGGALPTPSSREPHSPHLPSNPGSPGQRSALATPKGRGRGDRGDGGGSGPGSPKAAEGSERPRQFVTLNTASQLSPSEPGSSDASSLPSPTSDLTAAAGGEQEHSTGTALMSPDSSKAFGSGEIRAPVNLGRGFRRNAGGGDVANIHAPTRPLLFRQFLEGIIRLAPARFPNERGLETQIQRLFKERLIPAFEGQASSEHVFAFLALKPFQQPLEEFTPSLWALFQSAAVGVPGAGSAEGIEGSRGDALYPQAFAGERHLQIKGRVGTCVRIKDALRLLDSCGLLRPMSAKVLPPEDGTGAAVFSAQHREDPFSCDSSNAADADDAASATRAASSEGQVQAQLADQQRNAMGSFMGPTGGGFGFMAPTPSMLNGGSEGFAQPPAEQPQRVGSKKDRRTSKGSAGGQAASISGSDAGRLTEVSAADLASCDFAMSCHQALRFLAESLSPQCLPDLHWELDCSQILPTDEMVAALDFAETELVFTEFLRLLVQLAELGTRRNIALCERMPLAKRFDGFLRHVFLPACRAPYAPPAAKEEQKEDDNEEGAALDGSSAVDDDDAAAVEEAAADGQVATGSQEGDGASQEEGEAGSPAAEEAVPEEPLPELWAGFEGRRPAPKAAARGAGRRAAARCGRHWPEGYEQETRDW